MKKLVILSVMMAALFLPGKAQAQVPHEIAGFTLGENISAHRDLIKPETDLPVRHMEYLSEAEVKVPDGYKSGLVVYGNCDKPGQIVKISVKYAYPEKDFYDELLQRFKERYGEPGEWLGDPFHVYLAWKWSFTGRNNNKVSMILQHFTGEDDEYKAGNSLKLSLTSAIEKECQCYERKYPKGAGKVRTEKPAVDYKKLNLDPFVPR